MRNKTRLLAFFAIASVVFAACSSGATSAPPAASAPAVATAAASGPTAAPAAATAAAPASSQAGAADVSSFHFANVVKITGIAWFNRMATGLQDFSKATGVKVDQTGPAQATAEGQVSIIQSLIPQKPTVIGVVPNDQQALEGVLGSAKAAGIVVVSQEGSQLQNTDLDVEAFSNTAYGTAMMDSLAKCMGGQGQYAAFVGHLTSQSHMEWVSAALQEAKSKYPGISRVSDPIESLEDANVAYQKTKELLAKYPNLKGIEGSAATDVVGAARAITELGLAGKVCIVGTSLPSLAKQYVVNKTIYSIFGWDPALAGEAAMYGALQIAQGKAITTGADLHVPGYNNIQPCGGSASPHCFMGNAPLEIGPDNINNYPF